MGFQTVQSEKATAMARFNRLRAIATFRRFFEALFVFFVLLWSAKLAGKWVLNLCNYAYTPLFSFLVFNLIIAVLVVLSRRDGGEGEGGTVVPGLVVFDESDFEILSLAEDLKMVVFSETEGKTDADVTEEDRKMDFFKLSEIGVEKIDFPEAEKDRKIGFCNLSEVGVKKIDFPVAEKDRKADGLKKIDFPAAEENRKIDFCDLSEIGVKKIDFPAAEEDRKMVVFSEIGGKIDFPASLPPCVAAAEAAIEAARRRIRRFERSQSARLRRDIEVGSPCQQRLLRRSETERPISVIDRVDKLSSEEFRRTIDEFIARQKKAEKQLLVDI